MRRVLGGLIALIVALACATSSVAAGAARPAPSGSSSVAGDSAATATESLALAMLARLNPGSNTVVSPFSIETALAMVDQGASGQTATQLDDALGGAASPAALALANRQLDAALRSAVTAYGAGGPQLNAADNLWLQSGLTLRTPFARTLAADFGAAPQHADFRADPSGAIETINNWVSNQTDGLIPTLMSPAEVNAQTELVLANAVYLHAAWQHAFDPHETAKATFSSPSGPVSVPFMSEGIDGARSYPYARTSRYEAVALPYAHSSLQFLAVMPPAGQIGSLSRWLTPARLGTLTGSLRSESLDLSMPKFTFSSDTTLNDFLKGIGITRAFGPDSQLDEMVSSGQPLAIQAVVHDATLEVAEKGTTAAAATGVSLTPTAVAPVAVQVVLNHPFLVFIRDTKTGAILFAARVLDPATA